MWGCLWCVSRKGNGLIFPYLDREIVPLVDECGNANLLRDVAINPGKSYLFFVSFQVPGIGLPGDRDVGSVKHCGYCGVQSIDGGP